MAEDLNLELNKDDFEDIELSDIEKLLKLLNSDARTKESDLKEFDYDILDDNDWFESDTEEKIKWTIESMKDMKEKISFIEGIIKHVKVFEIKRKEERQKMLEQSIDELSWISMSDYRHTEPEPIQSKNDISSNFSLNWQNNQSPINLSVSWQNNQSSIFDSFSLTSSQSRLRPVVEWNDLGIGSFAINTYNETLNKEEIINHLEYWMDNIADENVIISMQKELISIKKWKQAGDLTYLLISYSVNKEREMTKWMSLARWAHNDTQKYYINNIIWNTKWYSEKYIQWYNTDLWNYIKETKDFEEEAKHKKPESINSLELTHYLLMLEDNNTLTTEKLLSVFWRAFLLWLWELWEERKEKWAPSKLQELIQNKWLESLFNISVISNHQLSDIMPLIKDHEKRINWKTNEYFISNPEHIRLINDKERLTSVLEHYKSNNEFLSIKNINPKLLTSFIDNDNIILDITSIDTLDKEIIEENIDSLIAALRINNKDNGFISALLTKAASLLVRPRFIYDIVQEYNVEIPHHHWYLLWYIWEYDELNEQQYEDFDKLKEKYWDFSNLTKEEIEEITKNTEISNLITQYIIINSNFLNIPDSYQSKLFINLIKNNFIWANWEFLHISHSNIEISKVFAEKNLLYFIPKLHLKSKELLQSYLYEILKSDEEDFSYKLTMLKYFDLSDFNRVLQIYKFINDLSYNSYMWWTNDKIYALKNTLNSKLKDDWVKNIIINSLLDSRDNKVQISEEYKDSYLSLTDELKINSKGIFKDFENSTTEYNKTITDDENINQDDLSRFSTKLDDWLQVVFKKHKLWGDQEDDFREAIINTFSNGKINIDSLEAIIKDLSQSIWMEEDELLKDLADVISDTMLKEAKLRTAKSAQKLGSSTLNTCSTGLTDWANAISEYTLNKSKIEKYLIDVNWFWDQALNSELIQSEYLKIISTKKFHNEADYEEFRDSFLIDFKFLQNGNIEIYNQLIELLQNIQNEHEIVFVKENTKLIIEHAKNNSEISFDEFIQNKIDNDELNVDNIQDDSNIETSESSNNDNTPSNILSTESYDYNTESGIIKTSSWDEIPVIEEDKKNLNSKENIENYISLFSTLKDLKLSRLWPHINTISNSIWTTGWINNNSWFLEPVEQQKIINCILISVWMKTLGNFRTMEEYIWKYERDIFWFDWTTENDSTRIWETKVDEEFLKRYITNRPKFAHDEFKDSLNKKRNY